MNDTPIRATREPDRLISNRKEAQIRMWKVAAALKNVGIDPDALVEFVEGWKTKDF